MFLGCTCIGGAQGPAGSHRKAVSSSPWARGAGGSSESSHRRVNKRASEVVPKRNLTQYSEYLRKDVVLITV